MRPLLRLALFSLTFGLPSVASAHLELARHHSHDVPERKGFVIGMALQPGIAQYGRGVVPVTRFKYLLGGGISDRVTLGAEIGVQKHHGFKKIGLVSDIVVTGFLGRGLFVRLGAGVASQTVLMARDPLAPGFGGLVGLGYEWRVAEKLGLGFGIDYDVRMRPDRLPAQTLVLGVRLGGDLRK